MNDKQKFSAQVCTFCAIGIMLCLLFAAITQSCTPEQAEQLNADVQANFKGE